MNFVIACETGLLDPTCCCRSCDSGCGAVRIRPTAISVLVRCRRNNCSLSDPGARHESAWCGMFWVIVVSVAISAQRSGRGGFGGVEYVDGCMTVTRVLAEATPPHRGILDALRATTARMIVDVQLSWRTHTALPCRVARSSAAHGCFRDTKPTPAKFRRLCADPI